MGGPGFEHVLTDRLDLRQVAMPDLDELELINADPEGSRYLPVGAGRGPAGTSAWIERFAARWAGHGLGYWTVRLRGNGQVIGLGGVDRRQLFWNLYYRIDRHYWGRGYATELAGAAQRAALTIDADLPIVAWIHAGNLASQAIASRLGLHDYGRLQGEHWKGEPMHYWADRVPPAAITAS